MKRNRFLIGMGLMCLLGTVQAFGQTAERSYYVRADGDDEANNGRSEDAPFATLKKAIEMAAAGAVRTITVIGTVDASSIYSGGTKEIIITGKPEASETEKAVILSEIGIRNSKIRFTHVKITNMSGRGLSISEGAEVTLGENVLITGCKSYGAVEVDRGTLNMTDNSTISGNINTVSGSGGGGVYLRAGTINMSGSATISGNTAEYDGGGVYVRGGTHEGTINMSGNATISGNTAGNGGGAYIYYGTINMSGNAVISGNTAEYDGGGVYGNVTLSGSAAISGNTARRGGGVSGSVTLSGSATISDNKANSEGGGVNGSVTISGNAAISDNKAAETGGGVDGGVTMKGGKISGNTAKQGGGVYNGYNGRVSYSGIMENGEIYGNKAEYGAGYYVETGKLTVAGGKITANEAEFVGGGVYVKGGATYEAGKGVSVTGNKAGDGEGEDVFRQ
jgi:hypothetical protein